MRATLKSRPTCFPTSAVPLPYLDGSGMMWRDSRGRTGPHGPHLIPRPEARLALRSLVVHKRAPFILGDPHRSVCLPTS